MSNNVFTEEDNNKTFHAVVGEVFTIELKGNPTTGYTWLREGINGMQLSDATFEIQTKFNSRSHDEKGKGRRRLLVGAGGTMELEVKALKPGSHTLSLFYGRPWIGERGAAKHYKLNVVVDP